MIEHSGCRMDADNTLQSPGLPIGPTWHEGAVTVIRCAAKYTGLLALPTPYRPVPRREYRLLVPTSIQIKNIRTETSNG